MKSLARGHTGGARITGQLPSGLHIPRSEACTRETPKQNTGPSGDSFRSVTPGKSKPEIKAVDTSQLSSPKPAVGCGPADKGGEEKGQTKESPTPAGPGTTASRPTGLAQLHKGGHSFLVANLGPEVQSCSPVHVLCSMSLRHPVGWH